MYLGFYTRRDKSFAQSELLSRSDVSERMLGTSPSIETVVSIERLFEKTLFFDSLKKKRRQKPPFFLFCPGQSAATISIHEVALLSIAMPVPS